MRMSPYFNIVYRSNSRHGTGRYHYRYKEGSRYEEVDADTVTDVLNAILDANGLTPHADPWIDSGEKTVSLARVRMHARGFARMHADEKDILLEPVSK
jgi:hypothetical protein